MQCFQWALTCSKLTIETVEQGVKYVQSQGVKHVGVVLVSLLLTLNIFHTCFSVSIVNFEQVNAIGKTKQMHLFLFYNSKNKVYKSQVAYIQNMQVSLICFAFVFPPQTIN